MTLAKAFVTGTVIKSPEKRFTQNDTAIVSFTVDIDPANEVLLRVVSFGQLADNIAGTITQGDNVAIEGKLQISTYKLPNGKDKRVYEIAAGSVEKIGTGTVSQSAVSAANEIPETNMAEEETIVNFDTVPANDLIDEDEIPF